jgi:hypothetical protein
MTFIFHPPRPLALLAVAALGLGGCAGHSDFMTKVPEATAPLAAPPNSATIAFIRDSGLGFAVNFSIIDQAGNLLGDAVARSDFALQVPPGRYFFFARGSENTDAVQADVAAGYVYYLHVIPHFGAFTARVELDPVKPNEKEWASLPGWLTHSNHLMPLIPKTPASLHETPLPDWASKAWSSLSPVEQAAHSVTITDGRALSPNAPAPPAPIAAAP